MSPQLRQPSLGRRKRSKLTRHFQLKKHQLKRIIFKTLKVTHHDDWPGKLFDNFMIGLISLNVVAFAFETVSSVSIPYKSYFNNFETFSAVIFTVEYGLRLWTCTLERGFRHFLWGRIKFVAMPLSIIDLLSILPFYLFIFFPNLVFIREIHLLRLARLLKIGRYSESMRTLAKVISTKRQDLLSAMFTVFTLLMISSSLVYFFEHASQPDLFPNIPASMWWAVVTLTSVGYGDVYPVTPIGKLLGGVIAVLGLGLVALPTGILASGFAERVQQKREQPVCPHCGKQLHS
ncbi:MAG: ion transporter [Cyanobacteria bacterium J06621_3]